jgi:hypothetical protein
MKLWVELIDFYKPDTALYVDVALQMSHPSEPSQIERLVKIAFYFIHYYVKLAKKSYSKGTLSTKSNRPKKVSYFMQWFQWCSSLLRIWNWGRRRGRGRGRGSSEASDGLCIVQRCHIFLGTTYQNDKKYTKWLKYNKWQKVTAISFTNIFYCKTLQNLPKLGFFVWNNTIWQPCRCSIDWIIVDNLWPQGQNWPLIQQGLAYIGRSCEIFYLSSFLEIHFCRSKRYRLVTCWINGFGLENKPN